MFWIIFGCVFGVLFLTLIIIALVILNKLFWVKKYDPIVTYEDEDFEIKQCNKIKYLLDKGLPYKGDFKTTNKYDYLKEFNFSSDKNCSSNSLVGEITNVVIPDCYNKLDSKYRDYVGNVWYQTDIYINKSTEYNVARLNFSGSFLHTEVYIDGKLIGTNSEGYLPFCFDISSLDNGKHNLIIKVNNQCAKDTIPTSLFEGHKLGWYHYSGLHSEVYIEYQPCVSVFKLQTIPIQINENDWKMEVSILAESRINTPEILMTLKLINEGEVVSSSKITVLNNDKIIGKTVEICITEPKLWSELEANLYEVMLTTPYEMVTVTTGFRKVSWGNGKIYINDQETFLKGVCRHEDSGKAGLATTPNIIQDELNKIKDISGNFVRNGHYPHSTITYDFLDKMGLYSWDEVPFYQAGQYITHAVFGKGLGAVGVKKSALKNLLIGINETALTRDKKLVKLTCQSLIKMIERDINHPSIISWSVGNEIWSVNKATGKMLKYLKDVVKSFDTSRACNYASICMPIMAQKYESSFEVMDWVCVNEYYGWYYLDIKHVSSLAKSVAKKYPNKPFVITETGSDTLYGLRDYQNIPPKEKCSEDYQCYFLREQHRYLKNSAPNFSGMCVWVFKDFPCPEYDENNGVPFYNMKGLFDKDMNEKKAYREMEKIFRSHDKRLSK